jgi:hypothetical protein
MPLQVCSGAQLKCNFGQCQSNLNILPINQVNADQKAAAVIMNNIPMVNIAPFGMCTSLSNPTVASATAAAFGTLTPMPCIPITLSPWSPGASKINIRGLRALTKQCKLHCAYAGIIQIIQPGQDKVNLI